ncbi:acyl carrier protein [Saccharothrix longispora]|jgi:methoxymalonate biosynthesis acyl carrier protein|uniref:acyl carrier protein n=1 Tax=Saccharothrix longispora TaxID=33920 RepID=UPI0028FD5429|nr:phosphopantetheine-binding protein [Saccharothrix longispora]MBY8849770.1 acyl carrier protein [Saccharothrix sp. MB29]MDU0288155.1 phosphopantetheine-binding protein [Saccharothrix longispora]
MRNGVPAEEVRSQLLAFVTSLVDAEPGLDEDYFERGLVNSLAALELVTFVEHRFGITVQAEDLDLDNFRTVNRLTGFVLVKTAG